MRAPPRTPKDGLVQERADLRLLARRIDAIDGQGARGAAGVVSTGWTRTDRALAERTGKRTDDTAARGGLPNGAIHEWFGVHDVLLSEVRRQASGGAWSPPLALLAHLAARALAPGPGGSGGSGDGARQVLWIGRRVWPYPRALVGDLELRARGECEASCTVVCDVLHRAELELVVSARNDPDDAQRLISCSSFVDVAQRAERLWAIDVALRCPRVAAVVADASELDMAATRRLQLAAEAGRGIGLFARPPREEGVLSVAATRWRVRRAEPRADVSAPRWELELLRCKSVLGYGGDRSVPCAASSR